MKLNLYRIYYKPLYSVGGGFAFVLAVDEEKAKDAWVCDGSTPDDWEKRFESIEEIHKAEFYNGRVLINENGDY